MIKGRPLQHIGVACADVEANAKWYQEVLGFECQARFFNNGHNVYFLKNGPAVYELYQEDGLDAAVQGKVDHIAFDSYDIEADYAFCLAQGYKIATNGIEELPNFWEKGFRYFKIVSPCGEQIEFGQIL